MLGGCKPFDKTTWKMADPGMQELTSAREEADGVDALGVAGPGVDPFLGQVAVLVLLLLFLGWVHPAAPCDRIALLLAVEMALLGNLRRCRVPPLATLCTHHQNVSEASSH